MNVDCQVGSTTRNIDGQAKWSGLIGWRTDSSGFLEIGEINIITDSDEIRAAVSFRTGDDVGRVFASGSTNGKKGKGCGINDERFSVKDPSENLVLFEGDGECCGDTLTRELGRNGGVDIANTAARSAIEVIVGRG